MILQDDGNARRERSKRQHLRMEIKAMHVTDIRSEIAQQCAQSGMSACRRCAAEGQKIIMDALLRQVLRMLGRLHNRNGATGLADCIGDVDERRPRDQKLFRQASRGITEKADLGHV